MNTTGQQGSRQMKILQATLNRALAEMSQSEAFSSRPEELADAVSKMVPELVDSMAESMLATVRRNAPLDLQENRQFRRGFEERLYQRWQEPLDLLDLFISIAIETGGDFNSRVRESGEVLGNAVFESLSRLHARACQTSSAILVLLKSGYADDAHARWRSLHEIAVVSQFISVKGQCVAQKYLLHGAIQRYKLAKLLRDNAGRINEEPLPNQEFAELKACHDGLVTRFGNPFKGDYGWAASTLNDKRPGIIDIEQEIDQAHWRTYYRMASDNVHANSHGVYWRLGLIGVNERALLAGPSHMGLTDPSHATAISLNLITTLLLAVRPNFDDVVATKILGALVHEVGEAFLRVHREIEGSETVITKKLP